MPAVPAVQTAAAARLRVFLVDDHELFRSGVRAELGDDFDVVGEASEVDAAAEMILERRPDVVLLDVHLPGGGGREVARRVMAVAPEVCFLALSVSDAAEDVIGVIRAGARGYVTKTISGPSWATPSAGWPTATPSSPAAWPGSSSTPSPPGSDRPTTPRSTSSPPASRRSCA